MKTFEELKQQITPEIIKKMCELAEGFTITKKYEQYFINIGKIDSALFEDLFKEYNVLILSALLHRAVEGWNKKERTSQKIQHNILSVLENRVLLFYNDNYYYKNYQPCHLTACEMAILDCLSEVLYD